MFLFRYAIKPTEKLVYDADISNEHWLVTYNQATRRYKAVEIGEVKTVSMNFTSDSKKDVYGVMVFYIRLSANLEIRLTPTLTITKGYYKFTTYSRLNKTGHNLHPDQAKVEPITEKEYAASVDIEIPKSVLKNKSTKW
jgi:hypothetical protein